MVPEGWSIERVGDTGNVHAGRQRSPHFTKGKLSPYLRVANVFDGRIDTSDVNEMLFTEREFSRYVLKPGDILLNEGQSIELVGRVAMYGGDPFNCCFQNTLVRYQAGPSIDPNYALALFQYCYHNGLFSRIATRTNSIAHLGVSRFADLSLLFPPLPEQRKIADILSTWDRAIETSEALLDTARSQKRALMQSLLTGKRRFPEFEGQEWKEVRLDAVAMIKKGQQKSKATLSNEGDYPVINGGMAPSGYTDEWNAEAGTITISEGGNSCGFVNMINARFWSGGHCYTLENLKVRRAFLFHYLKFKENRIMSLRVGSGLPNIQKKAISGFHLNVPPEAEQQQQIERVLNVAHKEENTISTNIAKLRTEKKALMQQLLTGKRRVVV